MVISYEVLVFCDYTYGQPMCAHIHISVCVPYHWELYS